MQQLPPVPFGFVFGSNSARFGFVCGSKLFFAEGLPLELAIDLDRISHVWIAHVHIGHVAIAIARIA
jgi:hypothetical protein